ncbi:hypothetical protein RFI_27254 [Reticulomyxa filosa]|uniref:Palmitoyltransferase n=1 Tax=Reticulomyxa filosa TaxID=46433 RepID=X6M814_RETFI|nr:hypothetical protein RFI_27254 [Reticulomyxa filosa]|eukprot:ETO10123.1 hypothetical protein RFI_27254 [Reticulomyxa filosa]
MSQPQSLSKIELAPSVAGRSNNSLQDKNNVVIRGASSPRRSVQLMNNYTISTASPAFSNSIAQSLLFPIMKLLLILRNALLKIPALMIGGIMLFIGYCTLGLAVPWRIRQETQDHGAPVFTVVLAIFFALLWILDLLSFIKCVITSSAVKDNPSSFVYRYLTINQNNSSNDREENNSHSSRLRVCEKCQQYKPIRAHHCSICQSCILKMDHHCPWVSNCVGYYNYKYFCLFIWYSALGCHVSSVICFSDLYVELAQGFAQQWNVQEYKGPKSGWLLISSVLTLAFGITLTCFGSFHAYLVSKGCTTIEFGQGGHYGRTAKENFENVFGQKWYSWFLPVLTASGDGYEFSIQNSTFSKKLRRGFENESDSSGEESGYGISDIESS